MVLGSATPSIESYYRAKTGVYHLHKLEQREKGALPKVWLVDLREELKKENKSVFSEKLQELIKDRLEKKTADHVVYQQTGICRLCVMQRLWRSIEMSSL